MKNLETELSDLLPSISREIRVTLLDKIAELVERERERCVGLCRARAEVWRNTTAAKSSIAAAREEARARANEASYLADLLALSEEVRGFGGAR